MSWVSVAWDWYAANSDKVNPIAAGLGGAALVWAAVRQARTATNRHYEQTRGDQQRRLTESFSKAVEQLASDKIEARLGGIYTLERLAIEAIAQVRSPPWWRRQWRSARLRLSQGQRRLLRLIRPIERTKSDVQVQRAPPDPVSDLYWTVMETLTAFVRERARWEEPKAAALEMTPQSDLWQSGTQSGEAQPVPVLATDIAAVLEVIRRRPDTGRERERQRGWLLDLRATDFRGAVLGGVHLERAVLGGAHLERANLRGAHLEGAVLGGAHLERANLRGAHLEGAVLGEAHLEGASLSGAHLEGASLSAAHLEGAFLLGAHLEGAFLREAHLEGVNLDEAIGDAKTRLPKEVPRPAHWPPYEPEP